jgi:hypothetical protein
MEGDHEQIGLGAANGLVAIDAQQPQENLLDQVLDVGAMTAQTGGKEPAQPLPMLPLQVRHERLFIA